MPIMSTNTCVEIQAIILNVSRMVKLQVLSPFKEIALNRHGLRRLNEGARS